MKKSVYSLVLMEDVVEAIDSLAYSVGTSRSNLINQILAERVALITPEMQMKRIFDRMESLLDHYHHFQIQPHAAESMMSIRSVLKYKYNPTIRYAVTLNREMGDYIGEIKMISRSQSEMLQMNLSSFFEIWTKWEKENGLAGWDMDQSGKWSRNLGVLLEKYQDSQAVAQSIVTYIKAVDDGLKAYCNGCDLTLLSKHFKSYLKKELQKI